jgi:hypothetical protein
MACLLISKSAYSAKVLEIENMINRKGLVQAIFR